MTRCSSSITASPVGVPAILTLLLLAAAPATPTLAQEPTDPTECTQPEQSDFDFWVGHWEVRTEDGQLAGSNRITRAHGGCVLREEWEAVGGGTGESFNIYDAARDAWHQTWVDDQGRLLLLDGGLDARGRMVMQGERPGPDGSLVVDEISWEPLDDGTVLQVWSVSTDAGATWRELFRGTYHRVAEPR
jgi:hypothetical protein